MTRKCEICNKEFYARPSSVKKGRSKFCSSKCSHIKSKMGIVKKCKYCNKKFYVKKCHIKTRIYCSAKCLYQSRKGKGFVGISKLVGYGKDNPNWKGGKLLECIRCGKEFWEIPSKIKKGRRFCSGKCYSLFYVKRSSERYIGAKNPMWRGGISCEPYTTDWTEDLRRAIRKRDKYTCQICGKEPAIECHHIDYIKLNCNSDNLIILCKSCHSKTNYNREHWKKYFSS